MGVGQPLCCYSLSLARTPGLQHDANSQTGLARAPAKRWEQQACLGIEGERDTSRSGTAKSLRTRSLQVSTWPLKSFQTVQGILTSLVPEHQHFLSSLSRPFLIFPAMPGYGMARQCEWSRSACWSNGDASKFTQAICSEEIQAASTPPPPPHPKLLLSVPSPSAFLSLHFCLLEQSSSY